MESAQNRGCFAPPGWLPTPGLRVASDRPTGGAHGWLKSAVGRATGSELRTRKSLIRLDFIEHKSERSVMPQDTGVGRNVVLDGLNFASLRRVWEQTFGCAPQKVDPASIARFRSAMRGEYGGGEDRTHTGAGPSWSGTTGRSMSTSRLVMPSCPKTQTNSRSARWGRFDRHQPVASPRAGGRRRCRRFEFPVRAGKTPSSNGMPRSRAETWVQARAAPGPERASPLRRGSPGLDSRSSRDESANKRRNHAGMVPADRRLIKFSARG